MGNAAITIHHPNSLDHGIPYLESGKICDANNSMIRFEKKDGAAVGCGGRVTFKKTVASSEWTFKIRKENLVGLSVGVHIGVEAGSEDEAMDKLSIQYGITKSEMMEITTLIHSKISDENTYSELYVYVDYNGKNQGNLKWTKNDLNLKYEMRWAEDSEMIVDVKF